MNSKELAKKKLIVDAKEYTYYDIEEVAKANQVDIETIPYSIRILLESVIRQCDGESITEEHIADLLHWEKTKGEKESPFKPMRVILQDLTGVPAIVDLAAMREAVHALNGDPKVINPDIAVDLVIDHSVHVDEAGTKNALLDNMNLEFLRNKERYEFIKWAEGSFKNFRVVPPATGIIHQVNIEYLSDVILSKEGAEGDYLCPDSLFGTDSHTTMINGIGVLGWGVGGIEAEAAMLQEASYFPIPEVVGVRLVGALAPHVNATDLALKVTQVLRNEKVVGSFVEYFGKGYETLSLADRATIANMCPEYGATCAYCPIDEETLDYMRLTHRSEERVAIVDAYTKANHLYYNKDKEANYSRIIEIDLSEIETNLSGPKRPQDLIPMKEMHEAFGASLSAPKGNHGFGLSEEEIQTSAAVVLSGKEYQLTHGSVVIASITSCTNTSNPSVLIAAGLLAKKAVEKGLKSLPYVKTSLAPGSRAVSAYLENSGLQQYLDALGFQVVGYGCATCIGNSGPIDAAVEKTVREHELVAAAVLSGNRNFEGRIHPAVKANYLASPPLVVAYALTGRADFDWENEAIARDMDGNDVYLKDIWPDNEEIEECISTYVTSDLFAKSYADIFEQNEMWNGIATHAGERYQWNENSTYIANPPFFAAMTMEERTISPLNDLSVLAVFGDSITTDHISPAGAIPVDTPAGAYLISRGVSKEAFNSYGSRRGHHEVMMRGTLANIRIRNEVAEGKEGGYTKYWPTGQILPIYDAAMKYKKDGKGLIILAGSDYGMGSSRDWAAKGVNLLNVKAVIAKSFERIHRSNLVMMGVLPLEFVDGQDAHSLGLTGEEELSVDVDDTVGIHDVVQVVAKKKDGSIVEFKAKVRFDSASDIKFYKNQGILPYVIRKKMKQ